MRQPQLQRPGLKNIPLLNLNKQFFSITSRVLENKRHFLKKCFDNSSVIFSFDLHKVQSSI